MLPMHTYLAEGPSDNGGASRSRRQKLSLIHRTADAGLHELKTADRVWLARIFFRRQITSPVPLSTAISAQ
jgi:hypothetical protein